MSKRTFLNLLVVLFLLVPSLTVEAAPARQGGNLLVNGDFETGSGNSNTGLAVWSAWWFVDNCKGNDQLDYACQPNGFYKESPPGGSAFIHTGSGAVTVRNNWDPWTAGVKQLVSAPAGYGKTTLLSGWLKSLKQPVAWISLDEGDNDPVRFLTYLFSALRKIEPSVGEVLEISLQPSLQLEAAGRSRSSSRAAA